MENEFKNNLNENTENNINNKINDENSFTPIINSENTNQFDFIELDHIIGNLKDENENINNFMPFEENKKEEKNMTNLNENIDLNLIKSHSCDNFEIKQNSEIKVNIKNTELNYDTLFRSDSLPQNKLEINIKASLTVEDLKNDDNLLMRKMTVQKDEYIKHEDWNIDILQIEIIKTDLYNLFDTIKKCDMYSHFAKSENVNIGPVSTLDYMVESTFGFDKTLINQITEHILSLEKIIFRWRSIFGDGNCYYRAIIFSFLENIIFTKNIFLLQKIMTEINQKFDESYINTRNLPNNNKQEILNLNKNLILKILYLIYEILSQSNVESIQNSYEILIKSFLFCNAFDLGMVMYFRYKIYEFIKENWNKCYTKEFSVKIGNLLPSQYETEEGDFLYDKFFEEHLMKLNIDAEKIIIYLTPFVLKINLNIIIYEFDNSSVVVNRLFPCYLDNKQTINLLYRKTHYDLVYESKYFEEHSKELCYYVNLNENLKVVQNGVIDKMRLDSESNLINENDFSKNDNYPSDNYDINKVGSFDNICIFCNTPFLHKTNIFNLCLNCLNSELKNHMMANYLLLINENLFCYQNDKEVNIPKIFNDKFMGTHITLNRLAQISEKSLQDILREIKNKICVICSKNINQTNIYCSLPCGCVTCSKLCFDNYFNLVFNKLKTDKGVVVCICSYQFNNNDYKSLYGFLEKFKLKEHKKRLELYIISNFSRICIGGCLEDIRYSNKEFHLLYLKDPEILKLFKLKEFKHVICEDCFNMRRIKEKENLECILCNSTHKVIKIKKNMSHHKEDDCNIL